MSPHTGKFQGTLRLPKLKKYKSYKGSGLKGKNMGASGPASSLSDVSTTTCDDTGSCWKEERW